MTRIAKQLIITALAVTAPLPMAYASTADLTRHLVCEAKVLSGMCGSGKIRLEIEEGTFRASLDDSGCWGAAIQLQGTVLDSGRGKYPFFARHLELNSSQGATVATLDLQVPEPGESTPGLLRLQSRAPDEGGSGILLRSQYDLNCRQITHPPEPLKRCRSPWTGDPNCFPEHSQ